MSSNTRAKMKPSHGCCARYHARVFHVKTVAVTGGIGSGKSTLCQMFAEQGVPVLDLDKVGHAVLHEDTELQDELIACFGQGIANAAGVIQRPALAAIVFQDAEALAQLNRLIQPRIRQREQQWLRQQRTSYVIIEASSLIESGQHERMDIIVAVISDVDVRQARILRQGRYDEAMFQAILKRQCSDDERREVADYVVENNASMAQLHMAQQALHQQLLRHRKAHHE